MSTEGLGNISAVKCEWRCRRLILWVPAQSGLRERFAGIRHFGFLANRAKKHALPHCRKLLGLNPALPEIPNRSAHDQLLELAGIDLNRCPRCQKGTMIVVGELPRISCSAPWDSS